MKLDGKEKTWTKEKPTQEGWYWLKIDTTEMAKRQKSYLATIERPQLVTIYRDTEGQPLKVYLPEVDLTSFLKKIEGYWYGPIEEPEGLK